jgi:hypothetical protein
VKINDFEAKKKFYSAGPGITKLKLLVAVSKIICAASQTFWGEIFRCRHLVLMQ